MLLDKSKKQDERRIKCYNDKGYRLLVIWEKELKNVEELKNKIIKFDKEK